MNALVQAKTAEQQDLRRHRAVKMGWGETLALLDAAANVRLGCRPVTFVNRSMVARALLDRRCRSLLARRILLPSDRLAAVGLQFMSPRKAWAAFEPGQLVRSFLTYMQEGRKIALVGGDRQRLERAGNALAKHAPWHSFTVIVLPENLDRHGRSHSDEILERADCDILLVDSADWQSEVRLDSFLAFRHDGLVLHAGRVFDT
ncbi:hypothetical protein [Rhizobium oryzicola]|uniref:Uncharacterized protein n=1 Tax=Rhizobium oryzicola TaxID=1232668 RepID=A0ABT8SRT7_9HYPH|nr:hypothetical protein [Rhizobium oryzicola]MDO1581046.1 hypothetical protein [Rhizobium oryzicola]